MAQPLILRRRVSEPSFRYALVLNGTVPDVDIEVESVVGDIYYRWEDEPDMQPEFLGSAVAGHALQVPFDPKGRTMRLFLISQTGAGFRSVANFAEAVQTVFSPTSLPVLADLTFDSGPDEVTGTIATNGGTGTIRILRQFDDDGFFEVQSVAFDETEFVDEPPIDGTYSYKLMQDGLEGESNILTVDVSGVSGETGTPPTDLDGSYGSDEVNLTWTNHGGTGSNIVERKIGSGGTFSPVATVASGTAAADIPVVLGPLNTVHYYRVRNESVSGYSNTLTVFIPRE